MILHRLDLDRAKARRVRDRGARHAGENDRADDVHVREPTARPSRKGNREIVNAIGDAGRIHQISGENKERHGQKREQIDAARHPVQDNEIRQAGDKMRVDEGRPSERNEHRNADKQHRNEQKRHNDHEKGPP